MPLDMLYGAGHTTTSSKISANERNVCVCVCSTMNDDDDYISEYEVA